ncbi:MAG: UvrD-helicase domain-containing protein [Chitinophagales bacterium]
MPLSIYKSSAGSGKTYTLVQEYVKLLVNSPREFRNILAITFTNKATNEMKGRIIEALSKLTAGTMPDLANQIVKDLNLIESQGSEKAALDHVKKQAYWALKRILHSYSEFNVSTIDSFFQQILRSFTKELKLPQRYEVEMNTSYVLDRVTTELFLDVGHTEGLTNWLTDFAFSEIEDNKGWKIETNIKDLGMEIFKEGVWKKLTKNEGEAVVGEEEIKEDRYEKMRDWSKKLWKIKRDFDNKMKSYAEQALEFIKGYSLETKDFKRGTAACFEVVLTGKYDFSKATLLKIYAGKESEWTTKKSPNRAKIEMLVQNGLQQIFVEMVDFYEKNLINYYSATAVLKNIYVYGILNDLKDKLVDYRTRENLMLISDTPNLMRSIVHDSSLEFIFEKVGMVYKHILLDEFQDTSEAQWHSLAYLVNNSIAEDNQSLVVGDVKQSIYRWRGGEMNLLLNNMAGTIPPAYFTAETEKDLATNYRSREHIVKFNNAFFIATAKVLEYELTQNDMPNVAQITKAYASVSQAINNEKGGFVEINFLPKTDWQTIAEEKLITLIGQLLDKGYNLRDIAILVRRNKDGNKVAEVLAAKGIKVISSESLLLKNSPKIRLLISILHYLADNRNIIAKTEILVNYLQLTKPELELDHSIFADHLQEKDDNLFYKILPKAFTDEIENLVKKPLYELVEMLIQLLKMQVDADTYIQRFQDLTLEHNTKQSPDIRNFLAWWEDKKESSDTAIIVPDGEDAVTVMTVHKAKGLEFPIVIMPYGEWDLMPSRMGVLWASSEREPYNEMGIIPLKISANLEKTYFAEDYKQEVLQSYLDNLNLLYVALTRPVDRLYIFTPQKGKTTKGIKKVSSLLDAVMHSPFFEYQEDYDLENRQFAYPDELSITEVGLNHKKSQDNIENLHHYISNNYHERITIRSESERFFMLFDNKASQAIKMGQKMHAVLEKLQSIDDLDKTIRKLQIQGTITTADVPIISARIHKIFKLSIVKRWFQPDWEVLAERPLLHNNNRLIPDRVIVKNNQAIVIDYKTVQDDSNLENQMSKYKKQVRKYGNILKDMKYEIAGMYLLFIGKEIWIENVLFD